MTSTSLRRLGLIGGMSWHSSIDYYRLINAAVESHLGGHHSADLMLASLDFDTIRACQLAEDWDEAAAVLVDAALRLERSGAEAVLICTNLMHKCAPAVENVLSVPLLHIADAVAEQAEAVRASRVGVVGSRWVMSESFYADRLARHGIRAISPHTDDHDFIDDVVFDELTKGITRAESRAGYRRIFHELADRGAQAIVLACTEIQLLVEASDSPVPLIDSMNSHAGYAARFALHADELTSA